MWNFCRILFGLFVGTAGIVGFALTPLTVPARLLYGALALLIVLPPESFAGGYYVNAVGIAGAIVAAGHRRICAAPASARRRSRRNVPCHYPQKTDPG